MKFIDCLNCEFYYESLCVSQEVTSDWDYRENIVFKEEYCNKYKYNIEKINIIIIGHQKYVKDCPLENNSLGV